jgi:hypothetical protein
MQSAAVGKNTRSGVPVSPREAPREGSRLREIFDSFQANKGIPIRIDIGHAIYSLRDTYGMDLICLIQKRRVNYQWLWVFAGEWFGDKYVDYIAQRIDGAEL